VLVDGDAMRFEVCHLGAGYWGAVGRVADAIVTIASRGVPLNSVQLERLSSGRPPPLDPPEIRERSQAVLRALDEPFALLPFGRVHRFADYWALRTIEMEHVHRRASKEGLTGPQSAALEKYWLSRVEAPPGDQLDELQFKRMDALHRSRAVRRNQARGAPRGRVRSSWPTMVEHTRPGSQDLVRQPLLGDPPLYLPCLLATVMKPGDLTAEKQSLR
jgi:hypothetical protein